MAIVVSYTTVSRMLLTLPEIQSRTNIRSAEFADFASRGESIINAKIARRYSLPFTVEIPILETLSTDIAIYLVLTRRVFTGEKKNDSTWPDRYKEALDMCDSIAAGTLALLDSSGGIISQSGNAGEAYSSSMNFEPTMTEDDPIRQIVDPDKIDEIQSDRDL